MDLVLYSAAGSNSSERVEWLLNYKGIAYQRVEVTSQALQTSYLSINPFGYVPSLSVDGAVLSESMAIAEYIEEQFDAPSLLGDDLLRKANIRRVCEFVNSTIHSPQNRTVLRFLRPELEESSKRTLRGEWISRCLDKLRPSICLDSNYAIGHQFSLADIFIASIYKKALQHGSAPIPFYDSHLHSLRSIERIANAEP
ncbi:glutathione S-transferase N-terminal domain-containing protein [Vibrio sp. D404a]|uniref:glutathione S-transferase family protein n=1 Tax=unclassified Vibrio TaxID=2614977 RepID=UPI002556D8E1|nr:MULTISPECIES: glutathione S-transferase family protein [unclassified Vibrio]MDK9737329.1 glutathione S-transferase N-terminal domain-containing protein [Vibrio sp. D404a]MDK9797995.1 glutathione S-transferase N-terminal domain-containing protein [Vibrio sp. D449a]